MSDEELRRQAWLRGEGCDIHTIDGMRPPCRRRCSRGGGGGGEPVLTDDGSVHGVDRVHAVHGDGNFFTSIGSVGQ